MRARERGAKMRRGGCRETDGAWRGDALIRREQSPGVLAMRRDVMGMSFPSAFARREDFRWEYGKGDMRHWAEACARCAAYADDVGRDAMERALLRARDDVRGVIDDERAVGRSGDDMEVFAAVRWMLRFMNEVCEHCGNREAFEHGATATRLLAVPELAMDAARLLATASRKSVTGRPMKNEYFNTKEFEGMKIALGRTSTSTTLVQGECVGLRVMETANGKKFSIRFTMRTRDGDNGEKIHDVETMFRPDMHEFELSDKVVNVFTFVDGDATALEKMEFFHPSTSTGAYLASKYGAITRLDENPEVMEIAYGAFAAHFEFMHAARSFFETATDAQSRRRERAATCLSVQIVLHTKTKDMSPYTAHGSCIHQLVDESSNIAHSALELLDSDRTDVPALSSRPLGDESLLRQDALNCLSALINERLCGFPVCQIIRRSESLRIVSKIMQGLLDDFKRNITSGSDGHFEALREMQSFMYFLGILSTSQPGCSAIKDASIVPCLVDMLKDTAAERLSILVDVVHTIESYLDFSQNEVSTFRELNGVDMLSSRMRHEALASLEEVKSAAEPERKRKANSMELDGGGETSGRSTPGGGDSPNRVSYHRRVLLKALMRTLAYTSFAVGGSRTRIPGLADGTLTETLSIVLRNAQAFGPGVSSLAANLLCDVIHNEPTCFATLDGAGIIDAYLYFITTSMWPVGTNKNMVKVLCAVPTTLNAIALNARGQEKVISSGAILCFRRIMNEASEIMTADVSKIIGSSMNELIRHSPALKSDGVKSIMSILADAKATAFSSNFALASKEVVEKMDVTRRLHNVARFMDGVLQTPHLCQPLLDEGALEHMLELVSRAAPATFAKCSAHQALTIACKALVSPPEVNAIREMHPFLTGTPPDESATAYRSCGAVCKSLTAVANTVHATLDELYSELTKADLEAYKLYDIYNQDAGDERLENQARACENAKRVCELMAGCERSCELMTFLVAMMPAMLFAVLDKTTLPAAFSVFSAASKIESILRDVNAAVDVSREQFSPVRWLYRCSESLMRTTSSLFASLAKVSTTMRRRKDLGHSKSNFVALTSEICWHIALKLKKDFIDLRRKLSASSKSVTENVNLHQRELQSLLALTYETFFDDRRNSPNGVMINYAARSGLFGELLTHFAETVSCTQSVFAKPSKTVEIRSAELNAARECFNSLRCFAKMFESLTDVKQVAAGAHFKLVLACEPPESVKDAGSNFPDMAMFSHIPDAFATNRAAMDWIHCSLNIGLKCIWDHANVKVLELMPAESADSLLNCFLHILGGTEQAMVAEQRRPSPPPRPVSTPPPARYVPSPDMMRAITEMGFSAGHAHHAITAVRGRSIESAMEYLFTHPMDDVSDVPPEEPVEAVPAPVAITTVALPDDASMHVASSSTQSGDRSHAITADEMPGVPDVVNTVFSLFLCSAERAAQILFAIINQHKLTGTSRKDAIQLVATEVLRDRSTGTEADSVFECKLYAFISSLAKQGDDEVRRALWGDPKLMNAQIDRFSATVLKAMSASITDIPVSFVTITNCINTSACMQKVNDDGSFAKFGFLSKDNLLRVADTCIDCLDRVIAEKKERSHEFTNNSVTSAILDLFANISRHPAVASRILGASKHKGKSVMRVLFDSFWNFEQESVSVIMRHVANDLKSLQMSMELEIIKSITKPPLGRDRKVSLKTFATAMKHVIERDFEVFQSAFRNVAEISNSSEGSNGERLYVVPKKHIKELQSLPDGKSSTGLRAVLEMLVDTIRDDIRREAAPHELERQAVSLRYLTELVEVNPASIKLLLKMDDEMGIFKSILLQQLPLSQHPSAPGVWNGAENAAFFLATLCVSSSKARTRIVEELLKLLSDEDLREETVPYHALVDFLHALMDFGLARGYQSGEKIRNRVVFNSQQGVVKAMYHSKVPEKLVALIRRIESKGVEANRGFLRVTLYVLEALVVRSKQPKRRDRLARIQNAIRSNVNASGGDAAGNEAAVAMIEQLLAGGARGHVQVTRLYDDERGEPVIENLPFGGDDMDIGDVAGVEGAAPHFEILGDGSMPGFRLVNDNRARSDDDDSTSGEVDSDDEDDHEMQESDEDDHFDDQMNHELDDEHQEDGIFSGDDDGGNDYEDEDEDDQMAMDEDDDDDEDNEDEYEEEEEEEEDEEEEGNAVDDDDEDDEDVQHDDGLYGDDIDEYDAFEPMTDTDEDDDEEEGDFEQADESSFSARHTPTSEALSSGIIPPTQHPFSFGPTVDAISRSQIEQWLATDYVTIMSGVDPRNAARSISQLQTFDRHAASHVRSIRVTEDAEPVPLVDGSTRPPTSRIAPFGSRRSSNIWATTPATEPDTASADDAGAHSLENRASGINVSRVGQSLNITLTAPTDARARSRSLQDVLTSISGEMARLAVRPGHMMEFLDPLSSAKPILWLGNGGFQTNAPKHFTVRDQAAWSLDGRHARSRFWSSAICMSVGESISSNPEFLFGEDAVPSSATVATGTEGKAVETNFESEVPTPNTAESPEQAQERLRLAAMELGIDPSVLAMLSADVRESFINANRLVAQARAMTPDGTAVVEPIDPEFIVALPSDLQSEIIRSTMQAATRVIGSNASTSLGSHAVISPANGVIVSAPAADASTQIMRQINQSFASWAHDIDRIGRAREEEEYVDTEEYKAFTCSVDFSELDVCTLLKLLQTKNNDVRDSAMKICVSLAVTEHNRDILLRLIFEMIFHRTQGKGVIDDVRYGQPPYEALAMQLMLLLQSLISRNKHVAKMQYVSRMSFECIDEAFKDMFTDSTTGTSSRDRREWYKFAAKNETIGDDTIDFSILLLLLQFATHPDRSLGASAHSDKTASLIALCVKAIDSMLMKQRKTAEDKWEPESVFQRAIPKSNIVGQLPALLKIRHLAAPILDKINNILKTFCVACTNLPNAPKMSSFIIATLNMHAVNCTRVLETNDGTNPGERRFAPTFLLRLTKSLIFLLSHLSSENKERVSTSNPLDKEAKDALMVFFRNCAPAWKLLAAHAETLKLKARKSDDDSGVGSIHEHWPKARVEETMDTSMMETLITTYLMITSALLPFLEEEMTQSRRHSVGGILSPPRMQSPAFGMRGSHASMGALSRASSQALDTLIHAGGENASVAAMISDMWKFMETHKDVLNRMIKSSPQLLSGPLKVMLQSPRLIDFDNKRAHVRSQIKKLRDKAGRANNQLKIRREHILQDSYNQLRMRSVAELRGKLSIAFVNEEGVDGGGLIREWFTILAREIFNPNIALFELSHDKGCYQPNPNSIINEEHLPYFRFVGRLVAKALFDDILLSAYFTRPIYKHMLGMPLTYDDMEGVDPDYYKSLKWMLENSIEGVFEYTFSETTSFFGETQVHDLIENGRNVPVTDENKFDYVNLVTAYRMTNAVKDQVAAFVKGFEEIIPRETISILNAAELELLISGTPDIDIEDLRANTEYHGYTVGSSQIQWFWDVVREMSKDDLARLLMFTTGTSKVPLDGFAALQGMQGPQRFQIHRQHADDQKLPSAHTCFNQLDLHEYSSKDVLRERLMYAIENCSEGFGFV